MCTYFYFSNNIIYNIIYNVNNVNNVNITYN